MSIGPILPGRLPNSLSSAHLTGILKDLNYQLYRLQDQAATGQKYFLPSDSPTEALRAIVLQRTLERQDHYKSSIAATRDLLVNTEASLNSVGDAAIRAKAIVLAGVGSSTTPAEKEALALEVDSLIRSVYNAANTQTRERYLYAGSLSQTQPFEITAAGVVRYNGDTKSIESRISADLTLGTNLSGAGAFSALSVPITSDIDPALTLQTRLKDLLGGRGVSLGTIQVTVDDGVNPIVTQSIDLTGAETVNDIKTRLEAAFDPGMLTVDIDPTSESGLRLTAAASVAVADVAGSRVARNLGILGGPAAAIVGSDLDPTVTLQTRLADLNGGAGIQNMAAGLRITNGPKSAVVDISTAVTVEDLFNLLEQQDLDLYIGINDAGNGLAISTRLSGADFSIGEDGGTTAGDLGIRTLSGATKLSSLNRGVGVPTDSTSVLNFRLNDGTDLQVSLSGALTVQDVVDRINALGNPNLTASLNSVGNGISLTDTSVGTEGFAVASNPASTALGIAGELPGNGTIAGTDVNPQESQGLLNVLLSLSKALRAGDDATLNRLNGLVDAQISKINVTRGDVANRLSFLDDVENRLLDQNVNLEESLSKAFHADLTEVISKLAAMQTALQATLQIAAQNQQLTLINYL